MDLTELLEYLAEGLVDDPEEVTVERFDEADGSVVLELAVGPEDYGKVIGRGGRTAQALRTVMAAAASGGQRVLVDIVDSGARGGRWIGVVGVAHGLDGSFYVGAPGADLLVSGTAVTLDGVERTIERRAGTDARPILRLAGATIAPARDALRGQALEIDDAPRPGWGPTSSGPGPRGRAVVDGERELGVVRRLLALPSCECLEVAARRRRPDLLVPLVRDAVRAVDSRAARIEVDSPFLGRPKLDVFTLFPAGSTGFARSATYRTRSRPAAR